jgi:tetratricopeptide (TPR) repeat protein
LVDEGLAVFDHYGVIAVPSLLLADGEGMIVELLEGYSNMTRDGFKERVLDILGVLQHEQEPATGVGGGYLPAGKAARYYQMGELFLGKKMARRAADAYRRAVSEDPNYAAAYLRLAEALDQRGKAGEAAKAREQGAALAAVAAPSEPPVDGPAGVDNSGTLRVEGETETAPAKTRGVP